MRVKPQKFLHFTICKPAYQPTWGSNDQTWEMLFYSRNLVLAKKKTWNLPSIKSGSTKKKIDEQNLDFRATPWIFLALQRGLELHPIDPYRTFLFFGWFQVRMVIPTSCYFLLLGWIGWLFFHPKKNVPWKQLLHRSYLYHWLSTWENLRGFLN